MQKKQLWPLCFLIILSVLLSLALVSCRREPSPSVESPDISESGSEMPSEEPADEVDLSVTRGEEMRKNDISQRPTFTKAQLQEQKAEGERIMKEIQEAASDLTKTSYTIPAGIYGFDLKGNRFQGNSNDLPSGFVLYEIDRPDDNPFVIHAEDVTFYFQTVGQPMGACGQTLHLVDCSNIQIEGLTMDYYNADDIEGEVTAIDTVNNRIAFRLFEGSMELTDQAIQRFLKGSDGRLCAVKPNGDFIVPLYKVSDDYGPGALKTSDLQPTGKPGEYWVTLKTKTLMQTIYTDRWQKVYGSAGTLEVGDSITLLYGVQLIMLDNCRKIVLRNVNSYGNKSGLFENGGYGDHLYQNCYFGPKKGTNQVLGHEGFLVQGLRHGSTYDGLYMDLTTDDSFNIHGFCSEARTIRENTILFKNAPVAIEEGDIIEAYSPAGKLLGTLTVKETPEIKYNHTVFLQSYVTFQTVPNYAKTEGVIFRFVNNECDGWKIINSTIKNCYQRILIQSGSGLIENNKIINLGSALSFGASLADYEFGFLGDITIRNNVFYNCTTHPKGTPFAFYSVSDWKETGNTSSFDIYDNVFISTGQLMYSQNFGEIKFHDNLIFRPLVYGTTVTSFSRMQGTLYGMGKTQVENNELFLLSFKGRKTDECHNDTVAISKDLQNKIDTFARYSDEDASEIVARIRQATR